MVITFEEEQGNPIVKYAIVVGVLAVIGAIGFFGYQYFQNLNEQAAKDIVPTQVTINWSTLKDERLNKLELFPSDSKMDGDMGKENPFNN